MTCTSKGDLGPQEVKTRQIPPGKCICEFLGLCSGSSSLAVLPSRALHRKLSPDQKSRFLEDYFHLDGLGCLTFRSCVGVDIPMPHILRAVVLLDVEPGSVYLWLSLQTHAKGASNSGVEPEVCRALSGYVLGRTHINSCDFSIGSYSFDDTDGDATRLHVAVLHIFI